MTIDLARVLAAEEALDRALREHGHPDPDRTAQWLASHAGEDAVKYKQVRIPEPLMVRLEAVSHIIRARHERDGIPSETLSRQVGYALALGLAQLEEQAGITATQEPLFTR